MNKDLVFESSAYSLIQTVQAAKGEGPIWLGSKGACRYCGKFEGGGRFKKEAHAFPEARGNKWVFSHDECDSCNKVFSRCEDALATMSGPILTLGGTPGKRNKVRQTGATNSRVNTGS